MQGEQKLQPWSWFWFRGKTFFKKY